MCHCVHLRFSPSHQFYIPLNITAKTYSHFFVYSRRSEMRSANMFHIHIFSNQYLQLFIDANQFLLFDSAAASLHMTRQCQVFRLSYKRKHFEFS